MSETEPRVAASRSGVGRRELMQWLIASAGGALFVPGLTLGHPMWKHLTDLDTLAIADAKAAASDWKPEFLDAHENETLIALAERIVPGSTKAHVNRFIDSVLGIDTPENQKKFLAALGAFDAESRSRFGRPFQTISEDQQNQILTTASNEKHGNAPANESWSWFSVPSKTPAEPIRITFRDHFENLKGHISGAYYSSEIGMRELGWKGQVFFESYPACEHPDGHRLS